MSARGPGCGRGGRRPGGARPASAASSRTRGGAAAGGARDLPHPPHGPPRADVSPRLDRPRGEAPDPAGRLERRVARMPDRAEEASLERRWELVEPLGVEPVGLERLELRPQIV